MKTCLNLGCGNHIVKSTKTEKWYNVDKFELSGKDEPDFLEGDVLQIPLESNSIDYLVCDQVLEHMAMADVYPALCEIRRVLKKGGRALIMVPDFEGAARQFLESDVHRIFDPAKYKWFAEVIYGNQETEGEFHRTPMTPMYLHYMLNLAGLTKHDIAFWPAFGDVPQYDGMRKQLPNATLRNAQLCVDLTKT